MGTRTERLLLSIEVTLLALILVLVGGGIIGLAVGAVGFSIALSSYLRTPSA
jgi:hypothetical protein